MQPSKNKGVIKKILIIDAELHICEVLKTRLEIIGYNIFLVADGKEGLSYFKQEQPDLIILDILIPKLNGYEVCQKIRYESNVPIIILTALDDITAKIAAFDIGVDDYIIKPFSLNELEARIHSILRRSVTENYQKPKKALTLTIGQLTIDTNTKQLLIDGKITKLTQIEFNLLELLINNIGIPLTRKFILKQIWGYSSEIIPNTRFIDVYISRVRSKLEKNSKNPSFIITIRGVGYMFQNFI